MIDFKLIEKSQINDLKKYYDYSNNIGCDINVLNAYLWRNEYNIKFAVVNNTLLKAYFNNDDTVWGYCMPVGSDVRGALHLIMQDARERNTSPYIVMLTTGQRGMLESTFPSQFVYERSPENQDYIYFTKDLVTLAGKRFHAKRNHISKFYKNFRDTHFETLSESNKKDAWQVVCEWCKENSVDINNYEEANVIKEALEIGEEFDMRGAVLYVDKKPVAMTMGSQISDRVFDINFEKALREYDGVYAVINNEFAKMLTTYEYINREEDMGVEGLRKAKLSYNPQIILDRFNAKLR